MTVRASATFMVAPEVEAIDRADLARLQLQRLQRTLAHAYANVAHYRQAFDAAGVTPDSLNSLADLRRFPFTVKTHLRDNYPY
ncbi:MAG: phenylacetate--CoA ligase, partial [Magnetospirillum sp.]|nr:phenylacetate--CoA ligase [Magnetospirillum sp.]